MNKIIWEDTSKGIPDMTKELQGTIASLYRGFAGMKCIATTSTIGVIELPDKRRAQVTIAVNTNEDDWE